MYLIRLISVLSISYLGAADFPVAFYDCGGVQGSCDYLGLYPNSKAMCDRAVEDPEALEAYLEAQRLALLILFGDEEIQAEARAEWERQDLDAYLYLLGVCVN